jgi:hypothetical protein
MDLLEIHDPLNPGRKVTEGVKCMERWGANWTRDCSCRAAPTSIRTARKPGNYNWCAFINTADE